MSIVSDGYSIIGTFAIILLVLCSRSSSNNLTINVDDSLTALYFDGLLVGNLPNAQVYDVADVVPLPAGTRLIAVHATNKAKAGWLIAGDSDGRVYTDRQWRYSTTPPSPSSTGRWTQADFDDSAWLTPMVIVTNGGPTGAHFPGVSRYASIIWSPGWIAEELDADRDVYFRYRIPKDVLARNFELIESEKMVAAAEDRCSQRIRRRCAARCGQLTMRVCAGFQYNRDMNTCCLLNATVLKAQRFVASVGWGVYSALVLTDPCC